ncbi:MAG: hypothetical protein EHM79_16290 [Geobacter sp.]|nr:MAG: hypothetical protein EHM79_16290 [Geobacter sp.]
MKITKISSAYTSYLEMFYRQNPKVAAMPYGEQKAALDRDAFGLADFWSMAMEPLGYRMQELTRNATPLQLAWARENGLAGLETDLRTIAVKQVRQFQPEILWYSDTDEELLLQILDAVPSICLVFGSVGSAIPRTGVWKHLDLVLSCAPEAVASMEKAGHTAAHLHHGFDPRVSGRLINRPKSVDASFIGQVVRSGGVHRQREEFLLAIAKETGLSIFSPSAGFTIRDDVRASAKSAVYRLAHGLRKTGLPESWVAALPLLGQTLSWEAAPVKPVSSRLRPFLRPAAFGIEMYQVIRDSCVTLNIHADSSPLFASNMRLFETTGTGTCLVTDWRDNIPELFTPDVEVVTYRNAAECVEKINWLVAHPREREAIASAGMRRTLSEHTFENRAVELDRIIRSALAKGRRTKRSS